MVVPTANNKRRAFCHWGQRHRADLVTSSKVARGGPGGGQHGNVRGGGRFLVGIQFCRFDNDTPRGKFNAIVVEGFLEPAIDLTPHQELVVWLGHEFDAQDKG